MPLAHWQCYMTPGSPRSPHPHYPLHDVSLVYMSDLVISGVLRKCISEFRQFWTQFRRARLSTWFRFCALRSFHGRHMWEGQRERPILCNGYLSSQQYIHSNSTSAEPTEDYRRLIFAQLVWYVLARFVPSKPEHTVVNRHYFPYNLMVAFTGTTYEASTSRYPNGDAGKNPANWTWVLLLKFRPWVGEFRHHNFNFAFACQRLYLLHCFVVFFQ